MPNVHEVNFTPNPVQRQFIESRARADLYSSRMGEGKSTAIAWACFYHTRHNPGARWAIIRDTWENLQSTTMKTFFEWFPPGVFGSFKQTTKTFTWANGVCEGEVEFLGMDDPQDASKLMSRELAGIAIDEPAPAVGSSGVAEMIFDIGMSRLRQPGMHWYGAKLAENNPDEAHWTYKRFVTDNLDGQFKVWQPTQAENEKNLPDGYYAQLRHLWRHRPDLVRRFVEGEFGFQAIGKAVCPQWSDRIHLGLGLIPVRGSPLSLLWDWGHNPTCIVTQKTPLGNWLILDSLVGEGIGAEELINDGVKPLLVERYKGYNLQHIGDPAGTQREQTSIHRSPVRLLLKSLGGTWRSGPVRLEERLEPLRSVLTRIHNGKGLLLVDKNRAAEAWHALRGGWHFNVTRTGITSGEPVKDIHSHPGDAVSYGAAVLFPLGKIGLQKKTFTPSAGPSFFSQGKGGELRIGPQSGKFPAHGSSLKG
jgi:hypothetical protein